MNGVRRTHRSQSSLAVCFLCQSLDMKWMIISIQLNAYSSSSAAGCGAGKSMKIISIVRTTSTYSVRCDKEVGLRINCSRYHKSSESAAGISKSVVIVVVVIPDIVPILSLPGSLSRQSSQ